MAGIYLLALVLLAFSVECVFRNLALNKPANQSSTYIKLWANRSVDGNPASCSHTKGFQIGPPRPTPWLEVDLLDVYYIRAVALTIPNGNIVWLHRFSIKIYTDTVENSTQCYYQNTRPPAGTIQLFFCETPIPGRFARVTIHAKNPNSQQLLRICEFRVFGTTDTINNMPFDRFDGLMISSAPSSVVNLDGRGICAMMCFSMRNCYVFSANEEFGSTSCSLYYNNNVILQVNDTLRYDAMATFMKT